MSVDTIFQGSRARRLIDGPANARFEPLAEAGRETSLRVWRMMRRGLV